jgi:hypothetical protein
MECCNANVRFWHYSEVPARLAYVGYWGKTGKHLLAMSFTGFDPRATSTANFAVTHNVALW